MQRLEIQQHVEEFLARGGVIQQLDHTESRYRGQPLKRKRAEQVKFLKERTYKR